MQTYLTRDHSTVLLCFQKIKKEEEKVESILATYESIQSIYNLKHQYKGQGLNIIFQSDDMQIICTTTSEIIEKLTLCKDVI